MYMDLNIFKRNEGYPSRKKDILRHILRQQPNIGEHQGSSEIILALRFHRPVQGPAEKFAF